nr:RsmG family class I SAM-dependent methyltransferase [Fodinibius salicampi]
MNVSRETFSNTDQLLEKYKPKIETYIDRLFWWNKRINLVSRDVSRETILEHIRHSLLLAQFESFTESQIIVDAGTGGGLPGLPLAITHPEKRFILNDIVSKKCMVLKQIARKLAINNTETIDVTIKNVQVQDPFLLISKHAFKINDLYKMTAHLPWSTMILYKGGNFKSELEGIEEPLDIQSIELSPGGDFYSGKALIIINR